MTPTTIRRTARAGAVLGLASLALVACGRDAGSDGPAEQGAAIDEGKATGTIEVWAMGTEGEVLGDFAKAFTDANPDAEVEVTAVPWESAHEKIANAIAAGETPDVTLVGTTWMGEFAQSGGLDPLPEDLVSSSDFFDGAWGSTEVGGTSYGVPWYVETRVLYYRKDLAQKAGWDKPPATWDELKQFATDLQDKGGAEYGIQLPAGGTGSWQTMLPFAWSAGAGVTNEDGTEYTLDTDEMTEALDYYKGYFDDGISPTRLLDAGELESGFADGTYGSFISGPWHTGLVEDQGVTEDQYAVAMLPGKDSGPGTSFVGGGDLAVFADSDNKESAWKLVQWLADPDTQQDFYDEMGDLPAVSAAWDSGELAEDPQLSIFGDQLDHTLAPPAVPTWEEVATVIDSQVEKATKGDTSVEDAVKEMQRQAAQIGTGL
ncbi:multiple sugar transport system substrate-binding protein [Nocardioides sp. BE266]|uniref:sugar ABC transporter substrate-binding protein n=1 Tax=Nocardioides sp. BE266 TaxID=2817725 RepID=UPI0028561575|nr:sugar ABC transporter substrate-binding protein [Nocardioides sp. BE266]MDR7252636.1 multiple sugar transport system substrate-binding protein [Nocardioides sp. BE266]